MRGPPFGAGVAKLVDAPALEAGEVGPFERSTSAGSSPVTGTNFYIGENLPPCKSLRMAEIRHFCILQPVATRLRSYFLAHPEIISA